MPFPRPHNVLQVFGTTGLAASPEIWSFRLRIGRDAAVTPAAGAVVDQLLSDVQADLTTWWNACATAFSNHVKMVGFKFVAVGTDGKYVSDAQTPQKAFPGDGLAGTAAGAMLPPQTTAVVTLRTAAARGLASKGRIFLPPFASGAVTNAGRLSPTVQVQVANATGTLLTNLNNWPGIDIAADPGDVVIASSVREGAMRKVTGIEVGDVFDTQRRRRNDLVEVRAKAAVS